MYARVGTFHDIPEQIETGIRTATEQLVPALQRLAGFRGPDWKERLEQGDAQSAAGRIERFEGDEAFLRSLMALGGKCADV